MLNLIRDNVQSFGVKFIVFIVVLVMAFFGISTYRDQSSNTLVTVDGYEVKMDRYSRAYENAREEIRQKYGARASDYLEMVNVKAQILNQLTSNALLLKSADENGLAVSDKELAHTIYNTSAFRTDERFDQSKYDNQLKNMRIDKLGYEKDLRESLITRKYFQFIGSGALFSRESLKDEYKRLDSEMEVKAIEIEPALFSDQAEVSDAEISEYYDLNKSSFQQKNQFALKYFILEAGDVKDKITVKERAISNYYDKNKDSEFTNKESFLSRHILIATPKDKNEEATKEARDRADSIYRQLLGDDKKFAQLAKTYSNDTGSAQKGGDLGWVDQGTFVSEFENAVAGLKKTEISKPFLSDFGYHIVQLMDRKPAEVQAFSEVKAEIEETIRTNMAKRRLNNQVTKLLSNPTGSSFEEMAESVEKKVAESDLFDDTKDLDKIGYTYQLYKELTGKTVGTKGQFKLAGDQKVMVYEVSKTKDPYVKPLDDVKEQVRYYALSEKKKTLAKEKLNEYAADIKTLNGFNGLAKKLKTKVVSSKFKFADRQVENLNVSNRFKVEAFKLSEGQISAIEDNGRGYLVYMMKKKEGVLDEDNKETLTILENMMKRQKSEIVLNGFINQLRREIEVEYNTPLLDALDIRLDS